MENTRKINKKKIQNMCLNCENCDGGDFCLLKNEFIDNNPPIYCDEFCQCDKTDEFNCGFSVIKPLCEIIDNIVLVKDFEFKGKQYIFKQPYELEFDYFDRQFVYYDENLNIFSAQKTLKELKNDFIEQLCENLSSKNAEFLKSFNKLVKTVGENEKNQANI